MKAYQYQTILIPDRGHLDDPELLTALNQQGVPEGSVRCPRCGKRGHSVASGWKHREDQPKGANALAILLEREVEIGIECESLLLVPGPDTTNVKLAS